MYQTKLLSDLLNNHIHARQNKSNSNTYITESNKIDSLKMEYESAMKQKK